jgi:hypothetical protein
MLAIPRHNKCDACSRPQYEAIDSYRFIEQSCNISVTLYNSSFAVQLPLIKYQRLNFSRGSSSQYPAASRHSSHVLTSHSASVRVSRLYRKNPAVSNVHFFFSSLNFRTSMPSKRKRLKDSSICGIVKALKKVK